MIPEQNLWPVVEKDFFVVVLLRGPGFSKMIDVQRTILASRYNGKFKWNLIIDVAFTKPRLQCNRKCLANAEREPEECRTFIHRQL